eukprot:5829535-Alexandrium_andersonii.AAC.2
MAHMCGARAVLGITRRLGEVVMAMAEEAVAITLGGDPHENCRIQSARFFCTAPCCGKSIQQ